MSLSRAKAAMLSCKGKNLKRKNLKAPMSLSHAKAALHHMRKKRSPKALLNLGYSKDS